MILQIMIAFIFYNFFFGLLFLSSEIIYKHMYSISNSFINEIIRKSVHITTALLFYSATFYLSQLFFITLSFEAFAVLIASNYLHIFNSAHLTREKNQNLGIYLFAIGLIITSILFYGQINAIRLGILILGIADTFASLIGKKYPLKAYILFHDKKSLGGSLTFFSLTVLLTLLFQQQFVLPLNFFILLSFAFNLTIIEAVSFKGADNLGILIITPLLLTSALLNIPLTFICVCFISITYGKYYYYNKRFRRNV